VWGGKIAEYNSREWNLRWLTILVVSSTVSGAGSGVSNTVGGIGDGASSMVGGAGKNVGGEFGVEVTPRLWTQTLTVTHIRADTIGGPAGKGLGDATGGVGKTLSSATGGLGKTVSSSSARLQTQRY